MEASSGFLIEDVTRLMLCQTTHSMGSWISLSILTFASFTQDLKAKHDVVHGGFSFFDNTES